MTAPLRILLISGSARRDSFNTRLLDVAAARLREAGAEPQRLDLGALALPIYDGDLEAAQGQPAGAQALVEALAAADALLIASPEYNAFPTPLLINALDWASRRPGFKAAAQGKPVAMVSASPGALGGLRGLLVLRNFLAVNLGFLVLPSQFALGGAGKAFEAGGGLAEAARLEVLDAVLAELRATATALRNPAA